MKFTKLTLQGFGPFRTKQVINFAALGEHGLFMISGPTGSGKSSILDAICFALYGETTSQGQGSGAVDGREAKELRCSLCLPEELTDVELEFIAGQKNYKVIRNPEYMRKNQRGAGETTNTPTATLYQQSDVNSGVWEIIASRKLSAVSEKIQEITGLTVEQFRRVIVLPQGRFRDVLIADYFTREEMLKRIFGTEVYERFEQEVDDRAKASRVQCDEHVQHLNRILRGQPWTEQLDRTVVHATATQRLVTSQTALDAAQKEKGLVNSDLDIKNQALGEAKLIAKLAEGVTSAKTALDAAKTASTAANPTREGLLAAKNATLPKVELDYLRKWSRELKSALDSQPAAIAANTAAKQNLADAFAAESTADAAMLPVKAMLEEISRIEVRVEAISKQRKDRDDATREINRARDEEQKANAAHKRCEENAIESKQRLAELEILLQKSRALFTQSAAARLALDLVHDGPCPVCGSVDHPDPAGATDGMVEQKTIDAEVKQVEDQRVAVEKAIKQQSDANVARVRSADLQSVKEIALSNIGEVEDDSALTKQRESLRSAISKLENELKTAQDAHKKSSSSADTARSALDASNKDVDRLTKEEADARNSFAAKLQDYSLRDEAAVERAWLPREAIDKLEREIRDIDAKLRDCDASHVALSNELAGRSASNVPLLQSEVDALKDRVETADSIINEQTALRDNLTKFRYEFAKAFADLTTIEADHQTATLLHGIVSGKSDQSQRLSLHGWVLGAVLDRVLANASELMRPLSSGRYELVRGTAVIDRRIAAGLDIEVLDNHTGQRRAARTLSGGETFLASLSLALALAEVAQAYHGARPLDTVFIDEGFGALDSDTLDTAMKALASLHGKGRIVGIISHVEEVKRQIPCQLHVTRNPATGESSVV